MTNGLATSSSRLYIAGTGMITAVGPTTTITCAFVAASASGYQTTRHRSKNGNPITMALVPAEVFDEVEYELETCPSYHAQFDHTIKMAIIAATQACHGRPITQPVPCLLAMPEPTLPPIMPNGLLTRNLAEHCAPVVSPALTRTFHSGRAAGMEAVGFAFDYLLDNPFLLIGGSDSPVHRERVKALDDANRLLNIKSADSFAPGEGAAFLLLTPDPQLAQVRDGCIIALHPPGLAEEAGHLFSEMPYRGDGLDQAFKKALAGQQEQSIQAIYSSMNGENFWAKEYGVAYLRNKPTFAEPLRIEHPADCYGDLGPATAVALIAMAAENLWNKKGQYKHLVYSSSDAAMRGALVVEKLPINIAN